MYGVRNNSVNFPAGYNNYGKNAPERNQSESRNIDEKNCTKRPEGKNGRSDEILFSAVQRKENEAYLKLSDKAKSYLSELSKKYPGYAFMVADYETDEEASSILSEGRGEINVLITPDLLEKMASDEATRAKYESIIDGAADQFAEIKNNLTDGGKSIVDRLGITVNADGTTSIYAFLKQGITGEDGSNVVSSSLVNEFTDMLNALAEAQQKMLEEKQQGVQDKPIDKEEEKEKSVLPPKSFEKYKKEPDPYATEEDFGTLPPESFEKYRKQENPYSIEEDYGNLPPESFKKYEEAAAAEVHAKPAESDVQMNFTV